VGSSPPLLSPPFRSRPLNRARGFGERCKLPQCGLGQSPSRQTIWCILESKSAAPVAAVFVDFPKNKCNFLHKNKLDIVRGSIPHRLAPHVRSFYRAMLCIRGTSHGPVSVCLSVCLSVTSQCSSKTAKRRITQTTSHDTSGTLVF